MDIRFLCIAMIFFFSGETTAADEQLSGSKLYMDACAKQELFADVPPLNFTCSDKIAGGYYADIDTGCHIFHLCAPSNLPTLTDHPFCCHPELVFDQRFLVCDRPENVDCPTSVRYYNDQFDGPVRVLERENEESRARNSERQSRVNSEPPLASDSLDQPQAIDTTISDKRSSDTDSQPADSPGKAVTLPQAFRQR